jgi:hypothetical protein
VRFVDEIGFAFGWIAPEPKSMLRASHAIAAGGLVWVIDPVDDDAALERIRALGEVGAVLQLLDRHNRDCAHVATRFDVPHYVVPDSAPDGAPFEVIPVLRRKRWQEVALWFPGHRTLVCADALGTAPYYCAQSERLAVSPLLRLTPPRTLLKVDPAHVLVGHGEGVHDDAAKAVLEAVTRSRRRLPAWLWAVLRSARR